MQIDNFFFQKAQEIHDLTSDINEVRRKLICFSQDMSHLCTNEKIEQSIKRLSKFIYAYSDSEDCLRELYKDMCQMRATHDEAVRNLIKLLNGKKNPSATIQKIRVSFGDGFYKAVELNGYDLLFCNKIATRLSPLSFPKGYFDAKTIKLSDDQLKELIEQVSAIEFEKWKSDDDIGDIACGAEYQRFRCEYSDGSSFEYGTRFTPPDSFRVMCDILVRYCDWSLLPSRPFEI